MQQQAAAAKVGSRPGDLSSDRCHRAGQGLLHGCLSLFLSPLGWLAASHSQLRSCSHRAGLSASSPHLGATVTGDGGDVDRLCLAGPPARVKQAGGHVDLAEAHVADAALVPAAGSQSPRAAVWSQASRRREAPRTRRYGDVRYEGNQARPNESTERGWQLLRSQAPFARMHASAKPSSAKAATGS